MALVTPYCTVSEADVYLSDSDSWIDLESSVKQNALFWGRVYLDSNYRCISFDESNAPDEIKFANALLAKDYTEGNLIKAGGKLSGSVKLKRVKAGKVEVETEYVGANKTSYQSDVDYLLNEYCTKKTSAKIINRL
jgi:hypothetical protein